MTIGGPTMRQFGRWARKRWIAAGVLVGLLGGLGADLAGPGRDPWPARLVITLPPDSHALGFSAHQRSFQTADSRTIAVWDLATGRPIEPAPSAWLWSKNLSRDGHSFVAMIDNETGSQQTVVLGDTATEAIRQRFLLPPRQRASHIRLIDDDRRIRAFVVQRDGALKVMTWDVASGVETTRPINGPGPEFKAPLRFSPDGRICVYWDFTRNGVQLWDSETDQAIGPLLRTPTTTPTSPIWMGVTTEFTPDGQTLLVGRTDGQVEFWDIHQLSWIKTLRLYPNDWLVYDLKVPPDGRTLISTGVVPPPLKLVGVAAAVAEVRRWFGGVRQWNQEADLVVTDLATDRTIARLARTAVGDIARDGQTIVTFDNNRTLAVRAFPPPSWHESPRSPER